MYKWNVHYDKIEIISFIVKFRSQLVLTVKFKCMSRYEADLIVYVVSFISNSVG
jgi:hypothetical protein